MGSSGRNRPGQVVRGRAEFECDLALGEQRDHGRVFERANAVTDPFRTENLDRVADARSAGRFARVGHGAQPVGARVCERPSVEGGREIRFVAPEADADDPQIRLAEPHCQPGRLKGAVDSEVAR